MRGIWDLLLNKKRLMYIRELFQHAVAANFLIYLYIKNNLRFWFRLGLDPTVLNKILNVSSGKTWVSDLYSPVPGVMANVPSSNDYKGGFGSALMLKDLSLAQGAATRTEAPTPLGGLALQLYRMLCSQGHGGKDFGYIFQLISAANKND